MSADIVAGGALGLLVGVLLALSVSPVVGTIMTSLTALVATFVGLSASDSSNSWLGSVRLSRLTSFALVCVFASLAGLWFRINNPFEKAPKQQMDEWKNAGVSSPEVYWAYQKFGLLPGGWTVAEKQTASPKDLVFFSGAAKACDLADPKRYGDDARKTLDGWRSLGPSWKAVAESLSRVSADNWEHLVPRVYALACEGAP